MVTVAPLCVAPVGAAAMFQITCGTTTSCPGSDKSPPVGVIPKSHGRSGALRNGPGVPSHGGKDRSTFALSLPYILLGSKRHDCGTPPTTARCHIAMIRSRFE